jgi:hypothetical protein
MVFSVVKQTHERTKLAPPVRRRYWFLGQDLGAVKK